ncbi:hypothetical protein [Gryllotalpicola protaetiae]|uniref:Uncharacterized protein n=1 Tax=Gryllotalpicola protaetiae TaxID=2419771 RepID=A0A387BW35_9MICO|nr:hypothetical protein [Gryllotalpicola protaetiae]AYG05119.1 hypothetical protein D7I44_17445 [Gryllotalpicola protaetiae]
MLHSAVLAAYEYHEHELPIPAIVYGIIGAVVFIFLGAVTWSYKDVARRHAPSGDPDAAQHQTSTGSEAHGSGHPGHH